MLLIAVCVVLPLCPTEKSIMWDNQYPDEDVFSPSSIDFVQDYLIQLLIIY